MSLAPSGLRLLATKRKDPTRTAQLRISWVADFKRRVDSIRSLNYKTLFVNDVLGLGEPKPDVRGIRRLAKKYVPSITALVDPTQISAYEDWLYRLIDTHILELTLLPTSVSGLAKKLRLTPTQVSNLERLQLIKSGEALPWTGVYLKGANTKGYQMALAALETQNLNLVVPFDIRKSLQQVLFKGASVFDPERLKQIYIRDFDDLQGISSFFKDSLKRSLSEGIAFGKNPQTIARDIASYTNIGLRRAVVLARTEVIRAHAEAVLTTFEEFKIEKVQVLAEFLTAGDERVCPQCEALEKQVYTIKEARGVIPVHPQCFPKGTLIFTPFGFRAIEKLRRGSYVLTGKGRWRQVLGKHHRRAIVPLVRIEAKGTGPLAHIRATEEHPFLVNGKWKAACEVKAGDRIRMLVSECRGCGKPVLYDKQACPGVTGCYQRAIQEGTLRPPLGGYNFGDIEVTDVWVTKPRGRVTRLYNITVDEDETYLAKTFVAHNCRCTWIPVQQKAARKKLPKTKNFPFDPTPEFTTPNKALKMLETLGSEAGKATGFGASGGLKRGVERGLAARMQAEGEVNREDLISLLEDFNLKPKDFHRSWSDERLFQRVADRIRASWAVTSMDEDPLSISLQLAAQEEFALKGTLKHVAVSEIKRAQVLLSKHEKVLRSWLRESYAWTQDILQKEGLDYITLYRGVVGNTNFSEFGWSPVQLQPLSSFSADPGVSAGFGNSGGYIISLRVPREYIHSFPKTGLGCLGESEFIVLSRLDGLPALERGLSYGEASKYGTNKNYGEFIRLELEKALGRKGLEDDLDEILGELKR